MARFDLDRLTPKRRDTIDRIWSALRVMCRHDIEIAVLAMSAGAPESSTADYVRLLVRSGFMSVSRPANGKSGHRTTYRLVRNSGPKAPRRAISVMADANSGECYALPHRTTPRSNKRLTLGSALVKQGVQAA